MATQPGVKLLAEIQGRFPKVKKVVDAKKNLRMTFAVDSRDCENGLVGNACECPASIGLARQTGKFAMVRRWVSVLIDPITWVATRYLNTAPLANVIHKYDAGKLDGTASFTPGVYTLHAPGVRQRLGRRPPLATVRPGSHPHKGPQSPLRQSWGSPTPRLGAIKSLVQETV